MYRTINETLMKEYQTLRSLKIGENILSQEQNQKYKLLDKYFRLLYKTRLDKDLGFKKEIEKYIENKIKQKKLNNIFAEIFKDPTEKFPNRRLEKILE